MRGRGGARGGIGVRSGTQRIGGVFQGLRNGRSVKRPQAPPLPWSRGPVLCSVPAKTVGAQRSADVPCPDQPWEWEATALPQAEAPTKRRSFSGLHCPSRAIACVNTSASEISHTNTASTGLLVSAWGKTQDMNEHVDWSAMSEEDFVALLRQIIESPEADED